MLLGLGLNLNKGGFVSSPYYSVLASAFRSRVQSDGGQVGNMSCLKSDLKELNPTKPSAFTGLLNDYSGAAAAYSLRLLDNTYTGDAIVVRRSSDNTTQAIGFVNNELDTTSLESFCSGTDGFVTTWYDQSGTANNATQTSASKQPKIVSSGTTITDNGKPTLEFNGSSSEFSITEISLGNYSNYFVSSVSDFGDNRTLIGKFTSDYYQVLSGGSSFKSNPGGTFTGFSGVVNTQFLLSLNRDASNVISSKKNGTSFGSTFTTSTTSNILFIGQANSIWRYKGKISEIVLYSSDQSSNRTGIETNINDFYSIY